MKTKRQATSDLMIAIMLVGIAVSSLAVLGYGLSATSCENLSCKVQLFYVYPIDSSNYWVELIILNDGDYPFDAHLRNFDAITISNFTTDGLTGIIPGDMVDIEFQFTGTVGNYLDMGFDIVSDDQSSFCTKKVAI
ncbi:MAG: hypothetical protein HRU07_09835 [Nitrosopumilus sp.]|nr:hypothetical protein [Nitrosopumilus sp.]NRA06427.1 hypothetical protein [Nitrosopumilus sp.]